MTHQDRDKTIPPRITLDLVPAGDTTNDAVQHVETKTETGHDTKDDNSNDDDDNEEDEEEEEEEEADDYGDAECAADERRSSGATRDDDDNESTDDDDELPKMPYRPNTRKAYHMFLAVKRREWQSLSQDEKRSWHEQATKANTEAMTAYERNRAIWDEAKQLRKRRTPQLTEILARMPSDLRVHATLMPAAAPPRGSATHGATRPSSSGSATRGGSSSGGSDSDSSGDHRRRRRRRRHQARRDRGGSSTSSNTGSSTHSDVQVDAEYVHYVHHWLLNCIILSRSPFVASSYPDITDTESFRMAWINKPSHECYPVWSFEPYCKVCDGLTDGITGRCILPWTTEQLIAAGFPRSLADQLGQSVKRLTKRGYEINVWRTEDTYIAVYDLMNWIVEHRGWQTKVPRARYCNEWLCMVKEWDWFLSQPAVTTSTSTSTTTSSSSSSNSSSSSTTPSTSALATATVPIAIPTATPATTTVATTPP